MHPLSKFCCLAAVVILGVVSLSTAISAFVHYSDDIVIQFLLGLSAFVITALQSVYFYEAASAKGWKAAGLWIAAALLTLISVLATSESIKQTFSGQVSSSVSEAGYQRALADKSTADAEVERLKAKIATMDALDRLSDSNDLEPMLMQAKAAAKEEESKIDEYEAAALAEPSTAEKVKFLGIGVLIDALRGICLALLAAAAMGGKQDMTPENTFTYGGFSISQVIQNEIASRELSAPQHPAPRATAAPVAPVAPVAKAAPESGSDEVLRMALCQIGVGNTASSDLLKKHLQIGSSKAAEMRARAGQLGWVTENGRALIITEAIHG